MNLPAGAFVLACRCCGRFLDEDNLPDPDLEDGLSYCLDAAECERLQRERMARADEKAERRRRGEDT